MISDPILKSSSLYRLVIWGTVSTIAVNEIKGFRKLLDDANLEMSFERQREKEGLYNKADGE